MGRIKIIVVLFLLQANTSIKSQIKPSFYQPSLLRSSATIAPTRFYNQNTTVAFINGFLEYVLEQHISVRGEGNIMVPNALLLMSLDPERFPRNCGSLYAGFGYHLGKNNWKFDILAEPGVLITELSQDPGLTVPVTYKWSVNPSYMLKLGTTYYFSRYCHFFAELNYGDAWARRTPMTSLSLAHYGISAGLGFHILTKRN